TERGIPVWVMEPVRGGKLAALGEAAEEKLRAFRTESSAAWAFRFLQGLPNVQMVLSGMSSMAQMVENVATFSERKPLSEAETALILEIAEAVKDSVPCTACRYCCDGCPQELDIPSLLSLYNDLRLQPSMGVVMRAECFPEGKRAVDCIACGKCSQICPQGIDVPAAMADFAERLTKLPSWAVVCKEREEAAKKKGV
ncbi:MAG: 4Fe-4S dicluster domain-containing protein, partial [Oscillospiraceae bacterium]|nr:4Fe-4S dicluster domain-containing protein [Oscillospiraceae bacterium]